MSFFKVVYNIGKRVELILLGEKMRSYTNFQTAEHSQRNK